MAMQGGEDDDDNMKYVLYLSSATEYVNADMVTHSDAMTHAYASARKRRPLR